MDRERERERSEKVRRALLPMTGKSLTINMQHYTEFTVRYYLWRHLLAAKSVGNKKLLSSTIAIEL
jgi:hypothetical protein